MFFVVCCVSAYVSVMFTYLSACVSVCVSWYTFDSAFRAVGLFACTHTHDCVCVCVQCKERRGPLDPEFGLSVPRSCEQASVGEHTNT